LPVSRQKWTGRISNGPDRMEKSVWFQLWLNSLPASKAMAFYCTSTLRCFWVTLCRGQLLSRY
jgi:hypothetical protein